MKVNDMNQRKLNYAQYFIKAIPQDWIERLALRELITEKASGLFDFSNA